jgi:nicotinamidase-related amidase
MVVDMQEDYCSPGYYMAQAGYDTQRLREPVTRIQRVVIAARRSGMQVLYTRHARTPNDDRLDNTATRGRVAQPARRGEPGWQIVPVLRPDLEDWVIEKSTCSAFASGELDRLLHSKRIRHLAICGNTIDVCVHSTLRAAIDLAYECLLLSDCCGAVNDGLHTWAIASVKIENGVFGTVANAEAFVQALST